MCAIAGVVSRAPLVEAPALAARLQGTLADRGPDHRDLRDHIVCNGEALGAFLEVGTRVRA